MWLLGDEGSVRDSSGDFSRINSIPPPRHNAYAPRQENANHMVLKPKHSAERQAAGEDARGYELGECVLRQVAFQA
jgi:hypothetical protein